MNEESAEKAMAKLKLRSSHWIVDEDNNIIIGKGRAEILENIELLLNTSTAKINGFLESGRLTI